MSDSFLVDSHCHIDFPDFDDDRSAIFEKARQSGVGGVLCVGVNLEDLRGILSLAASRTGVYASVGVHPNNEFVEETEPTVEDLVRLSSSDDVIAIGETGLDYFRSVGDLGWQRERFRIHLRAANSCGLPIIVHTRNAKVDTMRVIADVGGSSSGGVIHCFTEDWPMAKMALDAGFHISFSGIVTFKNARDIQDVARRTPADRILVETDAPYLSPVPMRGKRNEPAYVAETIKYLAELRKVAAQELAETTCVNFFQLFDKAVKLPSQAMFGRER